MASVEVAAGDMKRGLEIIVPLQSDEDAPAQEYLHHALLVPLGRVVQGGTARCVNQLRQLGSLAPIALV